MKNLFDPSAVQEVKQRVSQLRADSPRQWGKMTPSQAVAHCAIGVAVAVGDERPPRVFIGRILGGIIKPLALNDDKPMKKNSPTAKSMVVGDNRDFETERRRLLGLIDRFATAGPAGCTTHPHAFFGPMTPSEWAILMYKHLDHHLRQFGA
ncbi:MAG TPA: DUF1569 domain-containing protein [Gemmatimonadaceae bacterium]|jgi:hypothetical protein